MRLSRGGSVAGRCQRYMTAAGSNRTLDRQDETSNESRLTRTPPRIDKPPEAVRRQDLAYLNRFVPASTLSDSRLARRHCVPA